MSEATKKFVKDLAERAGKTFVQVWLAVSLAGAGLGDTEFETPNETFIDVLLSGSSLKVALGGAIISILTSLGSKKVGPDSTSASVVVATDDPTTHRA